MHKAGKFYQFDRAVCADYQVEILHAFTRLLGATHQGTTILPMAPGV